MPAIGFVAPLLAGKTDADREAMASCWHGERKPDHEASRRRAGITREAVWIQTTPAGEMAVVYMEADDPGAAMQMLARSDEPFDRWFRDHVRDVHGINLEDEFPPPEKVLDYSS